MANTGALTLLLFTITMMIHTITGQLVESKAEPTQYVSFPPSTFDERPFNVMHTTNNCMARTVRVDRSDEEVIICPNGELLLDGVTQANLEDNVTGDDIRTFYTWQEDSIPDNEAFITLRFPNNAITPTRVVVYCLVEDRDLDAREPRNIRLYPSTSNDIFPDEGEIRDVDENNYTVITSGTTSENEDYAYRKYDLIIPENRQVSLNYLRISLDFEGMNNWLFISEVEVYHMIEQLPTTTSSIMMSSSSVIISVTSSSSTPSASSTATRLPTSSIAIRTSLLSSMLSASSSTLSSSSSRLNNIQTNTPLVPFSTPVFVFPKDDPFVLQLNTMPLDVTINCTITWEGSLSQLTTMWSYNSTMIRNSQRYRITEGQLLIRQFTLEDAGIYECNVKHLPSEWNESRHYFITTNPGTSMTSRDGSDGSSKDSQIPIIIGAIAGIIGLLICLTTAICLVICCRKRKQEKDEKRISVTEKSASFLPPYEYVENGIPYEDRKRSIDNVYEHMIPSGTTLTNGGKMKEAKPPTLPRRLPRQPKTSELPAPKLPAKLKNDSMFLGDYIAMSVSSDMLNSDDLRETFFDIYDDTVISTALKSIPPNSPQDIYIEPFGHNSSNKKVCDTDSGTFDMCVPIYDDPSPLAETEAPNFVEWSDVSLVGKIGEGQFGDVYLAEIRGFDTSELKDTQSKSFAAIKTLKGNYSPSLKQQFEKEIKFMSRLDNANVVRLLGICNKKTPFIMMEYMSNGDLHLFLMKHYLPEHRDNTGAVIPVDILILQYIALQIANGMRYLASFGYIHRDLAARNCLVGEDYIVKIADFGMTQDLYNKAYFLLRGNAFLPIRWMAPESFFGKFSTKTDVWSYGVTLWEIFTLCRKQPYEEITDEDFITNAQNGFKKNTLDRPPSIPDAVYNVMIACWNYSPVQRPDFDSVYDELFDYYIKHSQK